MKVVFLARYLPQDGSTMQMYTLAKGLIDLGHEIHIISAGPPANIGAEMLFKGYLEFGGIHHTVKFPLNPGFNRLGKAIQLYRYLSVIPSVISVMKNIQPDIIHVHYPVTSYLAKIYCIMTNKKFITTYHISGIPKHLLHRKADYAIAISYDLKDELLYYYKYPAARIRLIHNGISTSKYYKTIDIAEKNAIKKTMGLEENAFTIGFVGSLVHRKGVDILLESIYRINDSNCQLVLLGDGDIKWVESLVDRFHLKERVKFYPFQDPIQFYKMFDIFVLPSRKEGFGLVAIEAMMMGVATVRSNVQGSCDQIDHGVTGIIFRNEDVEELAMQINILLRNTELRMSLAKNGQLAAIERFSDSRMLNDLLYLYKESVQ